MDLNQFYARINEKGVAKENIDSVRRTYNSFDVNRIKSPPITIKAEELTKEDSGRYDIKYNDLDLECYLNPKRNSDRLYVFFSGAKMQEELPLFKRWTYSDLLNCNSIYISDPMLRKHPKLRLGWYYGTSDISYSSVISDLIMEYARKIGVTNENIIFFSSSGGGYAAVLCAAIVSGSTATVINPQLSLRQYEYAERFMQITGIDLSSDDKFHRNDISVLINSSESRFIFVENIKSETDMIQYRYLCDKTGLSGIYGVKKQKNNIITWLYDADHKPQHNAQEWKTMFLALDNLARCFDDYGTPEYEYIYKIFNELWYEHFAAVVREKNLRILSSKAIKEINPGGCKISFENIIETHMDINECHDRFNHGGVNLTLIPQTIYHIKFRNMECDDECFSLVVKDNINNIVVFQKVIEITNVFDVYFCTSEQTDGLEIRVYPGKIGESEDKHFSAYISVGCPKQ